MSNLVVAITGASGSAYAVRLLEILLASDHAVHVTISPSGAHVLRHELGINIELDRFDASQLLGHVGNSNVDPRLSMMVCRETTDTQAASRFRDRDWLSSRLAYHHYQDFGAGIASGSFLTDGMVVCPCS
ncbi:MAG: 3-octaprenyl-4-hydroxybenzoate carboxy-lyase, partial [Planctomycetota bacterium]|nr:3-octaprenyl-4-hydroxybenzoate carboxy-lyase [Planctomycetota bacterium]